MDTVKSVLTRRLSQSAAAAGCLVQRAFELLTVTALLAVLALPGRAGAAAEPWPEIPLPPKSDAQWIAASMKVNGVPTRVMQFQSRASRAEVIAYYRAYWTGAYEHKPSVTALGDATVVGQAHGPYLMTVKVEDAPHEGSHGLISVALVIGSTVDRDPRELPLLPGAKVLSVVESDDPGKHSRQLLLVTSQPPTSVLEFYTTAFTGSGWVQVQGNDIPAPAGRPAAGGFVAFSQASSEMQLSVVATPKGRGSTILANLVTKDTGPGAD